MITNIYTIFDTKAGIYNKPFFLINDAVAERNARQLLTEPNDIQTNPEDFVLFKLGTYDDSSAEFDLLPAPAVMYRFHELLSNLPTDNAVADVS